MFYLTKGGPHSAFCSEFSAHVAVFYSLGFSVLLINYRGSSAYGQDSINSLPGKCGTSDVNDCQVKSFILIDLKTTQIDCKLKKTNCFNMYRLGSRVI